MISLTEGVLSMKNAVEEDSWKLTYRLKDFVYSASSLMEVVGLMFGLVSFFIGANDRRFSTLGLPLVVISNGVLEDDREMRILGFGGVVIQTLFIVGLLVVWLSLVAHLYYIITVAIGALVVNAYWIYERTDSCSRPTLDTAERGSVGHDVGGYWGAALLSSFRSNEAEVPRGVCYSLAVILVCSPPMIEVLECIYLLNDISLDTLGLLIADALTILPGVVWLLLQIRSFRRNTSGNT